ncbi:tetratricopeptide repeat protein [bacterium]|nr:tetratricopeptide repeat protein [bacterium]
MRRRNNTLHLALLWLLLTAQPLQAAFVHAPGKRVGALGGSGAADRGDPFGFFLNPASAAWGVATAFETEVGKPYWGLEGDNLLRNALGGYYSFSNWGTAAVGYDQFGSDLYREYRALAAYANRFGPFAAGVGINVLGRTYEQTPYTAVDPLFQQYGYTKNSVAVDLGVQYRVDERITLGLAGRRLNRPNQALEDGVSDPLPAEVQAGVGWRMTDRLLLVGDLEWRDRDIGGTDLTPRVGLEGVLFRDLLRLRAGGNRDEIAAGLSVRIFDGDYSRSYTRPASGGGTEKVEDRKTLRIRFGYTFRYPIGGIAGTAGTHTAGIDIFFDRQLSRTETEIQIQQRDRDRDIPKVVIQHDTVTVVQQEFVETMVEDTTRINALRQEIRRLKDDLQMVNNFNDALKHLEQAQIYFFDGRYDEAIEQCRLAIRLVPTMSYGYVRMGSIYYAQKKYAEAREAWETALELDPTYDQVKEYLKLLP